MKTAQLGSIRFLQILMAGSVVLPIVLFGCASWLNFRASYRAADERIERSLTILHEQSSYLFRSADLLLLSANQLLGSKNDDEIITNESQYHVLLEQLAQTVPQIRSIWIFAADGSPLVSSRIFPVPKSFSNRDRDYFQAHVDRDAGLFVGGVVDPKVPGEAIFSLSRRRSENIFSGVIAIAIRPTDIQRFYEAIGTLTGSYFALLRNDGAFLARYPTPTVLGLTLTGTSATRRAIAVQPETGILSLNSQTDGVDRRMGYERVKEFPLYVLAGIEEKAIRNEWLSHMTSYLIFGLPATSAMFFAIFYGMRRTKRLYKEAAAREAAEAALRQSQKMEAVGQLTGGVAHDFNNLLTIVMGNLAIAKKIIENQGEAISDRLRTAVTHAAEGAKRAATLTQRLLAFSRQQPLNPRIIDVNAALKEMSLLFQKALGENNSLEVVGSAGAWKVEIDPTQLEVALLNLVINSRDAMPDRGKVTVEVSNIHLDEAYSLKYADVKPGQYVSISVSDTGVGMPESVIARAFEPFFTTKPPGQGTGLGLSQVFGFIKQSGGHVTIYSELKHGTTVKMYFPRAYREVDRSEPKAPAEAIRGQGERVLVVEDDHDVRKFVSESLMELGYQVTQASSGEQAMEVSNQKEFDAVLTDVVMPGMNGRELAAAISARSPNIKILYMTGYSRNAIVHHGRLDAGVVLLQKPFSREELSVRLRSALM